MSTEDGSNKNSIDKEKTQEFLHKNGRYLIMAGMLVVILIGIVMLVNNKGTSSADPKARAEKVLKEDYQVDENEAVTKLMKNYYKYYAEGNVDKMKEIATPISKLEQSYIKMFSERVEKYKNIKCYTKEGLDKDSYIVSVTMDMKFPKIKTTIPSLETFYVRTDDKGNLYIDNLYSTFNYIATNEKDVDSSVSEFIDKYEEQDDFVKLANDIEKKSSKAIKSDKDLEKYVNKLNDKVIPKWLNNYKKAQEEEQKKKEEEQQTPSIVAAAGPIIIGGTDKKTDIKVTTAEPVQTTVPAATLTPATPVGKASTDMPGYTEIDLKQIPGEVYALMGSGKLVISIGKDEFNMTNMTANAGGALGYQSGKAVAYCTLSPDQPYEAIEKADSYTLKLYAPNQTTPSAVIECKKMPSQTTPQAGQPRTYVGEIVKLLMKK